MSFLPDDDLSAGFSDDGLWEEMRAKARQYGIAAVIPVHPQAEDDGDEAAVVTVVAVYARILDWGTHPNVLSVLGCMAAARQIREWGYTPRWEEDPLDDPSV